jgi:hypothetical protein
VYSTSTAPLYLNSPNGNGWLRGTVSWSNGPCTFWSNGGGIIKGQLLCNKIIIDTTGAGSAAANALEFVANYINPGIGEAALTE